MIDLAELPNVASSAFEVPGSARLRVSAAPHKPRILMLYGSLRGRSYSRFLTFEVARLLKQFGADVCVFDPSGLPLPDETTADHPKVQEQRELSQWSEGQVWTSPELHGAMSAILKAQIDWIPLTLGSVRRTPGRTLALMQVSGGSQSFNALNQMRMLGRWMRDVHRPKSVFCGEGIPGI